MVYVEEAMWLCGGMWGDVGGVEMDRMGLNPLPQKTSTSQPMDGWILGDAPTKGGGAWQEAKGINE